MIKLTFADLDLHNANLSYSDLSYSNLSGATINGEKIKVIFARVQHEGDPHSFAAITLETGSYKIASDSRWFTDAEFRAHVAAEYPDTPKAIETLAILDYIAARAVALGIE